MADVRAALAGFRKVFIGQLVPGENRYELVLTTRPSPPDGDLVEALRGALGDLIVREDSPIVEVEDGVAEARWHFYPPVDEREHDLFARLDWSHAVVVHERRGLMARHLYVHLPFCAHRCGYCDFVTAVGRPRRPRPLRRRAARRARARARLPGARGRDGLPRRRDADLHRACGARAAARRAARRGRGDRRGEPRDRDARARRAAAPKPRQPRLARRAELPAGPARGARACCRSGRRPARRLSST